MLKALIVILSLALCSPALAQGPEVKPKDEVNSGPCPVLASRLQETIPKTGESAPISIPVTSKRSELVPEVAQDPEKRRGHVDQAPKSWPYPMVVSPWRPVLPGTVW